MAPAVGIDGSGRFVVAWQSINQDGNSWGVFGRRFRRMGIGPIETSTGQLIAATVLLLPLASMIDRPWSLPVPGAATWAAVLGISLLSTALAFVLYFRILATAGATTRPLAASTTLARIW